MKQLEESKYDTLTVWVKGIGLAILVIGNFGLAGSAALDFVQGHGVWVAELGQKMYGEPWKLEYLVKALFYGGNFAAIMYYLLTSKQQEEIIRRVKRESKLNA